MPELPQYSQDWLNTQLRNQQLQTVDDQVRAFIQSRPVEERKINTNEGGPTPGARFEAPINPLKKLFMQFVTDPVNALPGMGMMEAGKFIPSAAKRLLSTTEKGTIFEDMMQVVDKIANGIAKSSPDIFRNGPGDLKQTGYMNVLRALLVKTLWILRRKSLTSSNMRVRRVSVFLESWVELLMKGKRSLVNK